MRSASGKFIIRIEPELHERLKAKTARVSKSLNELCAEVLARSVDSIPSGTAPDNALARPISGKFGSTFIGLVLFGSHAKGRTTSESDVDLLIVLDSDAEISRALYWSWDELALDPLLSPHFVRLPVDTSRVEGLWCEVAIDGIVLWDPSFQVSRFLAAVRREILDGRVTRKVSHSHPYWIRTEEAA
jgi:predicted nucleotidyltransferase